MFDEKKIIFMGTPDFAVPPLKLLCENNYNVIGVITQPDKPKGRSKALVPSPVKEEALRHDLPVYQPVKVRDPKFFEFLKDLAPDIIIVAAFGQIIPRCILDLPPYGCINIHGSLLPKYRGAAPIQWAIIDGEKETGNTIMKMAEGIDDGDMIAQGIVPIEKEDTAGTLFDKMAQNGAELLIKTLPSIFEGTAVYTSQPEESPTPYASMISKQMGKLDFDKNAAALVSLIHGLSPWPSAYTQLDGKTLKVWEAEAVEDIPYEGALPGMVTGMDKKGIYIKCKEGTLMILSLQMEGKKRMDAPSFLRGYHMEKGILLG